MSTPTKSCALVPSSTIRIVINVDACKVEESSGNSGGSSEFDRSGASDLALRLSSANDRLYTGRVKSFNKSTSNRVY